MSQEKNGRTVFYVPGKGWVDKNNSATRPSKYYETQQEAYNAGREHLEKQGGGEISIKRKSDGRIREKNTIAPGNDPSHIKG